MTRAVNQNLKELQYFPSKYSNITRLKGRWKYGISSVFPRKTQRNICCRSPSDGNNFLKAKEAIWGQNHFIFSLSWGVLQHLWDKGKKINPTFGVFIALIRRSKSTWWEVFPWKSGGKFVPCTNLDAHFWVLAKTTPQTHFYTKQIYNTMHNTLYIYTKLRFFLLNIPLSNG